MAKFSCKGCQPVLFKHEEGWDIYPKSECYRYDWVHWIPAWFDSPLIEDAPTKADAIAQWQKFHVMGVCCFI